MIDREKAAQMRRDGASYEEIGKVFGVSRERVRQVLKNQVRCRKYTTDMEKIAYEGLYNWLMDNQKVTFPALSYIMFGKRGTGHGNLMLNFVQGKNVKITKQSIDRLIAKTGMSYEQLFKLREGFEEEQNA